MSTEQTPAALWVQQGRIRSFAGYVLGLRQPSIALTLSAGADSHSVWLHLPTVWAQELIWVQATGQPALPPAWRSLPDGLAKVADWLLHWTVQLQRCTGLPVFEAGRVLTLRQITGKTASVTLVIPVAPRQSKAGYEAFRGVLQWFNNSLSLAVTQALDSEQKPNIPDQMEGLLALSQRLKKYVPRGSNNPRFLRAAFDMDIPVLALGNEVYQYGYGCRARWLDSTFTDATPTISAKMARNKAWTASLLRQSGVPVPPHEVVPDVETAVHVAKKIGFPVVVKPADLDGGKGVTAGLSSEQEVRDAYEHAKQHSTQILLEKHVPGRDYRLTIFNGVLLWAIERIPGGITGDGKSTVAQLLGQLNADSRRGEGPHAPLKRLVWDNEARSLLAKGGMDEHSVPPVDQFIPLRSIANIATGGMPVTVNKSVHPDNLQLAVRAAQSLRLDLAGVDLLIPDISRSWRETGAAVCEVNAQPQLGAITGPHLYSEILGKLVPGRGRIPITLVLGAAIGSTLAEQIATKLGAAGRCVGWSDERGAAIREQWLTAGKVNSFVAGHMLLSNSSVDAVVLSLNDDEVIRHGLPFDRFDLLVLAGPHMICAGLGEGGMSLQSVFSETLASVAPACTSKVLNLARSGLNVSEYNGLTSAQWITKPLSFDEVVTSVVAEMLNHKTYPS